MQFVIFRGLDIEYISEFDFHIVMPSSCFLFSKECLAYYSITCAFKHVVLRTDDKNRDYSITCAFKHFST